MLKNVWKDYVELYREYGNLREKHKKGTILATIVFIVYWAFVASCWRMIGKTDAELNTIKNIEK